MAAVSIAGAEPSNGLRGGEDRPYLSGALQWYGDLLGLLFYIVLLAGAVNLAMLLDFVFHRDITPGAAATRAVEIGEKAIRVTT